MSSAGSSHSKEDSLSTVEKDNKDNKVSSVKLHGDGDEFIILGNQKFYRHELMSAFGGSLNPGLAPYPVHKLGNPSPLGLAAFSMTTFVLSMYNAQAMGIQIPNVVVGLACFYGGAVQFLAGVYEFLVSNTFGATALTSYGAFWVSYAAINIENFGIVSAYGDDETQLENAIGFFLLAWGMFTFMLFLVTMKSTVAFALLFFSLFLTFILLAGGAFSGKVGVTRAGGVVGVITAFIGFYNAFAGVANSGNSYITVRPFFLTKQD